ncbi:hypothetical protein BT96DRAFT_836771 [Gymnopus androsaceus JB14]|uniref:DNA breaking-rejoining enzyme n=1 Tax=Gymnopus androsaceus JB14 TaxID=1447944 RepID=A0A6A4GQP2_9AGAR|nr:hypothetical protein BT96DRAFT_836771 [Gymnopus androsaceus JB14]
MPAPEWMIAKYAASFAGKFAGGTARSHLAALKSFHQTRGQPWLGGKVLSDMLNGVERQAPPSSFREEQPPVKEEHITLLHNRLNLSGSNGLHSCVAAAARSPFAGQMRAGKPLADNPNVDEYNHFDHPSIASLGPQSAEGTKCLKLPKTKVKQTKGETVIIPSTKFADMDPNDALDNHIRVNCLRLQDPLFAYRDQQDGLSVLMRKLFLNVCNQVWSCHNIPRFTGHSFRIGGTTHYLLAVVLPDIIKAMGCWKSNAFLKYWKNLDSLASIHIHRVHAQNSYQDCLQNHAFHTHN